MFWKNRAVKVEFYIYPAAIKGWAGSLFINGVKHRSITKRHLRDDEPSRFVEGLTAGEYYRQRVAENRPGVLALRERVPFDTPEEVEAQLQKIFSNYKERHPEKKFTAPVIHQMSYIDFFILNRELDRRRARFKNSLKV